MSITYTWKILELRVRNEGPNLNAVVQSFWQKIGTDEDGNEGIFDGATPFSASNVPPGEFIPFEDLTEEIVLGWIKNNIENSDGYETHINSVILNQINKKKNPIEEKPLPWVSNTSTSNTNI